MPAKYTMSWEPKTRRWTKMFRGRRFAISCRQLSVWTERHVPETKDGSYQVANRWWEQTKAQLVAAEPAHPHAVEIREARLRRDWLLERGEHEEAAAHEQIARSLEANPNGPSAREIAPRLRRHEVDDDPHTHRIVRATEDLARGGEVWSHRLKSGGEPASDRSVEAAIRGWLDLKTAKVRAGNDAPRGAAAH